MAKGIEINGMLKGKRGGVVYYRANGQQISRARNFNPSNPNTQKQRIQRMIMATVMNAYSYMREICDHSFENVKYKQESQSYFLRINANKLRAAANQEDGYARFTSKGIAALVPNTYGVSRGSLVAIPFENDPDDAMGAWRLGMGGSKLVNGAVPTLAAFMDATRSQAGDMLTYCVVKPTGTILYTETRGTSENDEVFETRFEYYRLKLKAAYTDTELAKPFYDANGIPDATLLVEGESSTGVKLFQPVERLESRIEYIPMASEVIGLAGCWIRSRFDGSKWARSSADMLVVPALGYGLSFDNAVISWEDNKTGLGNGDWLLNDKLNEGFQ